MDQNLLMLGEIKGTLETILPIVSRTEARVGQVETDVATIKAQIASRPRNGTVSWLKNLGLLIGGAVAGFFAK